MGSGKPTIKLITDAGYLSWVFGSSHYGYNSWIINKNKYLAKNGNLMVMDARPDFRKNVYPAYKQHRRDKLKVDPKQRERVASVRVFRDDVLVADPTIRTIKIDGLEADDLIAMTADLGYTEKVVGVDKDLLQIHDIQMMDHYGTPVDLYSFKKRKAKAIRGLITEPWHILFTLSLLGDKSDNVPRPLPSRRYDLVTGLYKSETPFQSAAELFQDNEYLLSLWLVLLPDPHVYNTVPTMEQLPTLLDNTVRKGIPLYNELGGYKQEYVDVFDTVIREYKTGFRSLQ